MKVVINKCYGGFSISPEAALWLYEKGFDEPEFATPVDEYWTDKYNGHHMFGKEANLRKWREYLATADHSKRDSLFVTVFTPDEKFVLDCRPKTRDHALLVECVETMGEAANGSCSNLKIIEIPDGVKYVVQEYDGLESVAEAHAVWG